VVGQHHAEKKETNKKKGRWKDGETKKKKEVITLLICVSNTGVPPYPRVIHSKTCRSYVKLRIILNTIYNVIFV
jgi:hypothetical protein